MQANATLWKGLVEDSQQLVKPTQIHQLLSKTDISEVHDLIKEIIHAFIDRGEHHIGIKTYINHILKNDVAPKMVENPPLENQTIEEWCKTIFKEEKFGMVLNTLEGYSNDFAEKAATLVSPLLKEAGLPLEGLSFLFFMGNYGFTPFGIHKESRGEEGVLFHLGPGKKTFYTWDTPEYNAVEHYQESFKNIEEMLPSAKAYVLNPGDAMFIPHQVFHIANSSEFSLSFVMDYINPPTDRFENQLLQEAAREELYLKSEYQTPIQSEFPYNFDKIGLLEKIDIAYKRRLLTLKSNAGILRKSKVVQGRHLPNGEFKIKAKSIFPLYWDKQSEEQIIVFARGHRFIKPYHPKINDFFNRLNQGETLSVGDIYASLQPYWDMVEVFGFVNELYSIDAIKLEIY